MTAATDKRRRDRAAKKPAEKPPVPPSHVHIRGEARRIEEFDPPVEHGQNYFGKPLPCSHPGDSPTREPHAYYFGEQIFCSEPDATAYAVDTFFDRVGAELNRRREETQRHVDATLASQAAVGTQITNAVSFAGWLAFIGLVIGGLAIAIAIG